MLAKCLKLRKENSFDALFCEGIATKEFQCDMEFMINYIALYIYKLHWNSLIVLIVYHYYIQKQILKSCYYTKSNFGHI